MRSSYYVGRHSSVICQRFRSPNCEHSAFLPWCTIRRAQVVRIGPPTCTIHRQCAVERAGGGSYVRMAAGYSVTFLQLRGTPESNFFSACFYKKKCLFPRVFVFNFLQRSRKRGDSTDPLNGVGPGAGCDAELGSGAEHNEMGPNRKEVRTARWSSALSVLLCRQVFTTSMHAWTSKRICSPTFRVCFRTPSCQATLEQAGPFSRVHRWAPLRGQVGRSRASRGQASCRVGSLHWPWLGLGVTPRKWPPKHVWGYGMSRK